ncbi:Splicing factor, partial [Dispira parvispora]
MSVRSTDSDSESDFSLIEDDDPVVTTNAVTELTNTTPPHVPYSLPLSPTKEHGEAVVAQNENHQIDALRDTLASNPYQYDKYVTLIQCLREHGCTAELETTRQAMQKHFGLSEDIWLAWLSDRTTQTTGADAKKKLLALYQTAVQDYLSINLWLAYLQAAMETYHTQTSSSEMENDSFLSLQDVRDICDQALLATRYHYPQGYTIFFAVRDFEMEQLLTITEDSADRENRIQRIDDLYQKQLSIPSPRLDDIFTDYSSFITTYRPANYEQIMVDTNRLVAEARIQTDRRERWETQLIESGHDFFTYRKYIHALQTSRTPVAPYEIATLYERAIVVHYLKPELWQSYAGFLFEDSTLRDKFVTVCARSVKNCPWSGQIWADYLRSCEMHPTSVQVDSVTIFEQAMCYFRSSPSLDDLVILCLEKLAQERRGCISTTPTADMQDMLRKSFRHYQGLVRELCQTHDPQFRLELYQIALETTVWQFADYARTLWQEVLHLRPTQVHVWIQYTEFEIRYGTIPTARESLVRALRVALDWPERLFDYSLTFEKLYGNMETAIGMTSKVNSARVAVEIRSQRMMAEQQEIEQQAEIKKERQRQRDRINKKRRRQKDRKQAQVSVTHAVEKRKRSPSEAERPSEASEEGGTLEEGLGNTTLAAKSGSTVVEEHPNPPLEKRPRYNEKRNLSAVDTVPASEDQSGESTANDTATVLVSCLHPSVRETELRDWFESCGPVKKVTLVRDMTGALKGYGYIEFLSPTSVSEALRTKHGQTLAGQTVTVHRYAATEADPRTVFVCNFLASTTSTQLQNLFATVGSVKQVRLPPTRRGKARCFAYIEFSTAADARKAVEQLNNYQWNMAHGALSVALSDPSKRHLPHGRPIPKTKNGRVLHVGNLPKSCTEDELRTLFNSFGTLSDVRLPKGLNLDQAKDFAFVEFRNSEDAERAQSALNGHIFEGQSLSVSVANPEKADASSHDFKGMVSQQSILPVQPSTTVRMTQFAQPVKLARLRQIFGQYGSVQRVHVNKEVSKVFVEYTHVAEATQAVEKLHNRVIDGSRIKVHFAAPKSQETTLTTPHQPATSAHTSVPTVSGMVP